jgi:hypothetical protein
MKRAFVPVTRRFRVLKDDDTSGKLTRRVRQRLGDRGITWKDLIGDERPRLLCLSLLPAHRFDNFGNAS